MKSNKIKEIFIQELKKLPVVEVVCKRTGIGRASFYRWKKEDEKFAKDAEEALNEGTLFINDVAESQLISAIKEKDMAAVRFWLVHRHSAYREKIKIMKPPKPREKETGLTPEQENLIDRVLEFEFGKKRNKKPENIKTIRINKELVYNVIPSH